MKNLQLMLIALLFNVATFAHNPGEYALGCTKCSNLHALLAGWEVANALTLEFDTYIENQEEDAYIKWKLYCSACEIKNMTGLSHCSCCNSDLSAEGAAFFINEEDSLELMGSACTKCSDAFGAKLGWGILDALTDGVDTSIENSYSKAAKEYQLYCLGKDSPENTNETTGD